jgi:hypothetical protein
MAGTSEGTGMDIVEGHPIERAGEYAVDFAMAQLLESSPPFRRWFTNRAIPDGDLGAYLGVTVHAAYAGEGESDVEFGVVTDDGERHVVMVENKIDAATQPDQFARYRHRGQFRVTRQGWEDFTVCLLAPDSYVTEEDAAAVDAVITYEDVIDRLAEIPNDAAPFCASVLRSAKQKSEIPDASETLLAIAREVDERDVGEYLEPVQAGKKSLVFRSAHPRHHDAFRYNVYVVERGAGGWTKVRVKLASGDAVTEQERDRLKAVVSDTGDALPEYEWKLHRQSDIGAKTLWHEEIGPDSPGGPYVESVVDELAALVETLHPIVIEADTK